MYSIIIKNGQIVDGTGKKVFQGDVAIEDGKIVQVGDLKNAKATQIIDATGKYVAPGFIDVQNHSDVYWTLFDNPAQHSLVAQGITTILTGHCGASLAPLLSRDGLLAARKWHNLEGINLNWLSFKDYLDELDKLKLGLNVASLVGYSTLRRGLIKDEIRSLTEGEQNAVEKALVESMNSGAFGMSSGLTYAHEAIISEVQLLALAKIVQKNSGLLSMHLRSEAAEITESISEALELVNQSGVNLKISHFKVRNKSNWHLLPHALNLFEEAYQKKGAIAFDIYPYDFVWQVLYTYLPRWAYEGGRDMMLAHLNDPIQRKKILAYLNSKDVGYSKMYIASTAVTMNVAGKTIGEVAERLNVSAEEALLTIVEKGGSEILVFDRNLDQTQVEQLLQHPLSLIGTDGAGFAFEKNDVLVHPRCFGTMPKYLALAFEKNIAIEQAVQKITDTAAQKIGLKKRGRIAVDYFADIVVFDREVNSSASYENPYQLPSGIEQVFVNGKRAVENSVLTKNFGGQVLRKN